MSNEIKFLLTRASGEIRSLRRQNEIMGAQLAVVEVFRAALLGPPGPQGMSEDICFAIDRLVNDTDPSAV
jgi:hypothetical protein